MPEEFEQEMNTSLGLYLVRHVTGKSVDRRNCGRYLLDRILPRRTGRFREYHAVIRNRKGAFESGLHTARVGYQLSNERLS